DDVEQRPSDQESGGPEPVGLQQREDALVDEHAVLDDLLVAGKHVPGEPSLVRSDRLQRLLELLDDHVEIPEHLALELRDGGNVGSFAADHIASVPSSERKISV